MDVVHRVSPKHSDERHKKKRDSIDTVLKTQLTLDMMKHTLAGE
jgi:hypothetical protein